MTVHVQNSTVTFWTTQLQNLVKTQVEIKMLSYVPE